MSEEEFSPMNLRLEAMIKANYLFEQGYNTYEEVMRMSVDEVQRRFDEITKGGEA